ncbi:hypothetical protein B0H14DRAFT_3129313 [Mycena olivaceomarginata]|nr:hypothetical protein B0H14DRAFT_3129313 [Mycena olivaceomarginata]
MDISAGLRSFSNEWNNSATFTTKPETSCPEAEVKGPEADIADPEDIAIVEDPGVDVKGPEANGKVRIPLAVDLETGIPEAKTQSSEMQDFSEPGLKDVERDDHHRCRSIFGGEIKEHRARGVPCKVKNHRYRLRTAESPAVPNRCELHATSDPSPTNTIVLSLHLGPAGLNAGPVLSPSRLQRESRAGGGSDRDGEVNELEGAMVGGRKEVFVDASLPVAANEHSRLSALPPFWGKKRRDGEARGVGASFRRGRLICRARWSLGCGCDCARALVDTHLPSPRWTEWICPRCPGHPHAPLDTEPRVPGAAIRIWKRQARSE